MLTVTTASNSSKLMIFGTSFSVDNLEWFKNVMVVFPIGLSEPVYYGLKPENGDPDSIGNKPVTHFNVRGNLIYVNSSVISRREVQKLAYLDINKKPAYFKRSEFFLAAKPTSYGSILAVWGDSPVSVRSPMYFRTTVSDAYTVVELKVEFYYGKYVYTSFLMYSRKTPGGSITKVVHNHNVYEFNDTFTKYRVKGFTDYTSENSDPRKLIYGSWNTATTSLVALGSTVTAIPDLPSYSQLRERFELSRIKANNIPDFVKFGDLVQQAADNTRALEINTPMYLKDLLQVMQLSKQLVSLATSNVSLKTLSAAYLVAHYGLKLTIKDTQAIAKALDEAHNMDASLPYQVARARASEYVEVKYGFPIPVYATIDYSVKLYYDPADDKLRQLWQQLHSWDVLPTPANLWDMIPFSFVMDWFIDIGSYLEAIDTRDYMQTLRIFTSIHSKRISINVPAEFFFGRTEQGYFIGNVELIDYCRNVTPIPPQPISRFDIPKSFTHWVEGAAIIIQKIVK